MDTQTQIDRLIELAIIQRTELKQLVEQLPQLREHLNSEVERTFEEAEPQIRTELEEFVTRQAADKTATLGVALEAKVAELAKSLEESAQAKYSALVATRDQNATLLAQAEERIAAAAGELPAKVKDIVAAELARFPRAGEIDQLRKEFAEPRGLNPRGKWQAGESYNKLDLVTINGDSYTSNTDNNITRPTRSSSDWTLVAARGTGGGGGPTSLSELTTVPSNGDILIGSGTSWVTSNLTAGAGISITVGAGEITISATDGDITLDDGTAASPSLHFTNDADTGLYRPAANTLGISVSGTQVAYFDTNGLTIPSAGVVAGGSFHGANGNANNPTFSFQSDQDTGMFRHGTNELGFTVGGTEKAVLTSTTFTVTPNFVGSGSGTFGGNLTVSGGTLTSGGNSGATLALSGNGSSGFRVDMFSGASGSASNTTYYNTTAAGAGNASYGRIGLLSNTSNRDMVIDTGSNGTGTAGNIAINPSGGILSTSGNLTVSGTGLSSVAGALNVTGALLAHQTSALNLAHEGSSLSQAVAYGADASTYGSFNVVLRKAGTGVGAITALTLNSTTATLAGNLTVSGTGTSTFGGSVRLPNASTLIILTSVGASGSAVAVGADDILRIGQSNANFTSTAIYGGTGNVSINAGASLAATFSPTTTTLAGNLTVSGGTVTSGTGTLTLNSSANTVVLQSAGTTALTLDSSQNATFAGKVTTTQVTTASGTTASTATGTAVTLFTISGTQGLFIVHAYLGVDDASNYAAFATVVMDGTAARIVSNNATLMSITLSGSSVQATQGSGTNLAIKWKYTRM